MSKYIKPIMKRHALIASKELPWIMTQMARAPIDSFDDASTYDRAYVYEQLVFFSKMFVQMYCQLSRGDPMKQREWAQAVGSIRRFGEFRNFLLRLAYVQKSADLLLKKFGADIANSNIIMTQEYSNDEDVKMYKYVVDQYNELIEQTKDYPDWQEKIKEEIGTIINQIHTKHASSPRFEAVLEKFPKQEFFK